MTDLRNAMIRRAMLARMRRNRAVVAPAGAKNLPHHTAVHVTVNNHLPGYPAERRQYKPQPS